MTDHRGARSRMTAPAWMTAAEAAAFERGTTAADAANAGVVHHTPAQQTFDPTYRPQVREPARLCAIGEEVFVGGRWLCVARRSVDHVELVDLDTGSTIAWPANQPIERQVRRP